MSGIKYRNTIIMKDFDVKAILRKDKKRLDGTCPVYLKVTIDRKSTKMPTKFKAEEPDWNVKQGCFKEAKSSPKNNALRKRRSEIEDFIYTQHAAGKDLTIELLKEQFAKKKDSGFYLLLDECYKAKFRSIKPGTKNHYLLVKTRLKEFNPNLSISDVTVDFLHRFEGWLIKKIGNKVNAIWQHHKILKMVINYGIKRKIIQDNPYTDFHVKRGEPRTEALTEHEVKILRELEFPREKNNRNRGLELSRDMFLFSCYTSLRFSDIVRIEKKHIIDDGHISIEQEKTGKLVSVPINKHAKQIIDKYLDEKRERIFPAKKNQVCNRDLKRIAEKCGIETNLHFHLSRHSFGTIWANKGLNAFTLSKVMGHSSIKTTMIYVNSDINSISRQMEAFNTFD